ncbi:hypothetical protein ACFKJ7_00225, partial [Streptococcus agalactiae]
TMALIKLQALFAVFDFLLLNIPTKMNLNELSEENQKLQKELEVLLEPLLNSRFILNNLYEFYFECRGNLQI